MEQREILFRANQTPDFEDELETPNAADEMCNKFTSGANLPSDDSKESRDELQREMDDDLANAFAGIDWDIVNEACSDPTGFAHRIDDEMLASVPIGHSRIGGTPDLPPNFEWPKWEGYFVPLLAQIDLSEVEAASGLLPSSGRLYVFGVRGNKISPVPYMIHHIDCEKSKLIRCARTSYEETWVPNDPEIETCHVLTPTIPMAVASRANFKTDIDVVASLLTSTVEGYGNANKIARNESLKGDDWIILFSMVSMEPRYNSGYLHLLIREAALRSRDFSNLHPFIWFGA